jgi:ligand-binding sensor domain-containing protein/signal transduction histidine kinase
MRLSERKTATAVLPLWLISLIMIGVIEGRAQQLPIRTYTTADGLPSTFIQFIVRDSRGFLWFCTRNGLSRFDGHRFVTYGEMHGLPTPVINHLLETRGGVYWVATNGGGVCRFNPDARVSSDGGRDAGGSLFTIYQVGDGHYSNRVNILYEDRAGRVWAGTDNGLYRLEETNGRMAFRFVEMGKPEIFSRPVSIGSLVEGRDGSLWINVISGLARLLPDGGVIHYAIQTTHQTDRDVSLLVSLFENREEEIWVGSRNGLIRFRPEPITTAVAPGARIYQKIVARKQVKFHGRNSVYQPLSAGEARWYTTADGLAHNVVTALHQSSDNRIWIGTLGGLTELKDGRFRSYTMAEGLSDDRVRPIIEDIDGNLWLGTVSGAIKLTMSGFVSYPSRNGIYSIHEDDAGEIFAISDNGFINRVDGRSFTSVRPRLPFGADIIWASQGGFLDRAGQWWISTSKGLFHFAGAIGIERLARQRPQAVYNTGAGLPSNSVACLFEDSGGDIWIGTRSNSQSNLARLERATGTLHSFSAAEGLPDLGSVSAFEADSNGKLWIGFYEGGLACYTSGRFTIFTRADGLPKGGVPSLHLDQSGRLWIATTRGGLSRIDNTDADHPRFVTYTTAEGLSSNDVRCITEDMNGRIYIGTASGVDRLDTSTGHVKHYTTADGLANSFVHSAHRDRKGRLWFGTMRGLSRFIPEPDRHQPPPPVKIGALRIEGLPLAVSELGAAEISGLTFGPNQNNIQIDIFELGVGAGEALRYQFKLEGADQDWGRPTDQRTVNYASLAPGTYRFLARAITTDNVVSLAPATITFEIRPPLWRRWWFLVLAATVVGALIYHFERRRIARLVELERVRARIGADLHDDIGSNLSQIAIMSEVARSQIVRGDTSALQQLSLIARISRESVDAMSDIVWAINPHRDRLRDLTGRMRLFAGEICVGRDISFRFHAHPPNQVDQDLRLSIDVRRQTFLIFKECVNNIVRHSACTQADIELSVAGKGLVLTLADNGQGFDPASVKEGHGLASIKRRAASLGGDLQIISTPGKGTIVSLKIPYLPD